MTSTWNPNPVPGRVVQALDSYGMNQTVINELYPKLVPLIAKANQVHGPIDVFGAMGGKPPWSGQVPVKANQHNSTWKPRAWWCDERNIT